MQTSPVCFDSLSRKESAHRGETDGCAPVFGSLPLYIRFSAATPYHRPWGYPVPETPPPTPPAAPASALPSAAGAPFSAASLPDAYSEADRPVPLIFCRRPAGSRRSQRASPREDPGTEARSSWHPAPSDTPPAAAPHVPSALLCAPVPYAVPAASVPGSSASPVLSPAVFSFSVGCGHTLPSLFPGSSSGCPAFPAHILPECCGQAAPHKPDYTVPPAGHRTPLCSSGHPAWMPLPEETAHNRPAFSSPLLPALSVPHTVPGFSGDCPHFPQKPCRNARTASCRSGPVPA